MQIAIVIPVLNDANALRSLLGEIRDWENQPAELIVAAAGDDPEIASLTHEQACRFIASKPLRGRQLDDGARAATADTLWFLHADSAPQRSSLDDIEAARAEGIEAGYFRFEFTGPRSWQKTLIEKLVSLRTRCGGMPYGDQGLWVSRDAYLRCDGFAHEPLFEEVRLIGRLRARGQLCALTTPIGVAPRRWEREGWWYRSIMNRVLALGHALGIPAKRLAAGYYRIAGLQEDRQA